MPLPACEVMPEGMKPSEIGVLSCSWSKQLPDLQLTMDVSLPHRVYVLGCGQFTYVGFEHKSRCMYALFSPRDVLGLMSCYLSTTKLAVDSK